LFFAWSLKSIQELRFDLTKVGNKDRVKLPFLFLIFFKLSLAEYTPDVFLCPVGEIPDLR